MKMRKKQTGRRIMAVLLSFLLLIGVMPVTVTPVRAEDATQSEVNADAGTDVDADANADADADVMPLADIVSGIVVVPLDITYDGAVHDAVEVQGMNADTDHVTYKLGDGDWADSCPQISDAGEYIVSVKVERDGYTPYESGAVTARIAKKQIENVEVTPYSGTYDETAHDVVAISEEGADYTISFKEENGDWTDVCPQIENVGTKTVTVKMERDNYETLTNDYTAEVLSGTIEGVSATLKTELVYTGTPQQLVESVTGTRAGDKIYYKIDDGAWIVNTDATAGMVTDAGTYKVSIKVERGSNYEAKEIELDPATVAVKKAPQTITFVKDNLTQVVFDETEPANNVYDYSAEGEPGNTRSITYRVENNAVSDTADIATIASIDQSTGELKILKGGYHIKVIATIAGDTNYESTEIAKSVTVKNCEKDLLSFKNAVVNVSLKDGAVLTGQKADKKYTDDNGEITYAALIDGNAETLDAYGLTINAVTGDISVTDLVLLGRKMTENNGGISIAVTAEKACGTKKELETEDEKTVYAAGDAGYKVNLTYAAVPANPYTLKTQNGEIVTGPDGNNGWFKTPVIVEAKSGYSIASGTLTAGFSDSVILDEQGTQARVVFLKNNTTDEITAPVTVTEIAKMDSVKPDANQISIAYSTPVVSNIFNFYKTKVTITFTAYDVTSGIDYFDWEYIKADVTGSGNLEADQGRVEAVRDGSDATKYTGTLTLPRNEADQLRGYLSVTATDQAGNQSDVKTDSGKIFVRDTISPTASVTYQLAGEGRQNRIGDKYYFSNDVVFTFDVVESNFFAEDVQVAVSKDGRVSRMENLNWTDTGKQDEHETTLTLSEDGDYFVYFSYADRSGNEVQTTYQSEMIVIDKTAPVITFTYDENTQIATVSVIERNFRKEDFKAAVEAENIYGESVACDVQTILRNCEWTRSGDVNTATISTQFMDASYVLTFDYSDLIGNAAQQIRTDSFVVDHTGPATATMSVKYSTSLLDMILEGITFGYYNPDVRVTFTASDEVSGVDHFTWSYTKQTGASDSNVSAYQDTVVAAEQDAGNRSRYSATVTLPAETAQQLRGNIAFTATDGKGNVSEKITDAGHVLVVDTIAPTMNVEYSQASRIAGSTMYYNGSVTAVLNVTEANFYRQDVEVKVTKNGQITSIAPDWNDISEDLHRGTIIIPAAADHADDGDYVITVSYQDRSNNTMAAYTSDVITVDTLNPVIDVAYANTNKINAVTDAEGHVRNYYNSVQTATVSVNEHNFDQNEVDLQITAKDIQGNELAIDSLCTRSGWSTEGDVHTMTITYAGSANYTFDVSYIDQAANPAADYAADYFTVDTNKAKNLEVSYSASILETILQGITFGFYNAKTTVTITATDDIAGVHSFKYSYLNAAGVSNTNAELRDQVIGADKITYSGGGATATATFEIPQEALGANNQFNGTIDFNATDRSGNESDYFEDTLRIVVDNISPTASVEYNTPVQTVDGVAYYDGDVTATVTIEEANFYAEDVEISVTRDDGAYNVDPVWVDESSDVHTGTFKLTGDGDYFVTISYSDKSTNEMETYTSDQLTVDTEIEEATIMADGQELDGRAFKDEIIPEVHFEDTNFESCEIRLVRTSFADKNVDVTDKFITGHIVTNANGGSGTFDTFAKEQDNDGIYTMTVSMNDKAGHSIEKSATFTVNRYGSVYEYSDYLVSLIADGGAYVQNVDKDLIITEYNADRLVDNSLDIEISKDGKPVEDASYSVSPDPASVTEAGTSGWYQYQYTIAKENFAKDGVYKVAVSSKDDTGNTPENSNYDNKNILFRVDSTAPEINSISGLENSIVNATQVAVKYTVYDTIGLQSVDVYVDGKNVDKITDFSDDVNNYTGTFTLSENQNAQHVQLVVYDLAGNSTDTDSKDFSSEYAFHNMVTVSTNLFVRWFANKALFWGTIGGVGAVCAGTAAGVTVFRRRKIKHSAQ